MMWLLCDSWRDSFSCVTGLTHISDVIDLICFTHLNESRDLRVIHTCQSSDRTCSFTLLSHETYSDVWNVSVIWHDLFIHTPKSRDLFRCVKRVSHLTWLVWTVSFIWHGVFIHRSAITTREWSSDGIHIWWMTFIYDGWCCYNAWCHSSYHSYMMNDGIHIYGIHMWWMMVFIYMVFIDMNSIIRHIWMIWCTTPRVLTRDHIMNDIARSCTWTYHSSDMTCSFTLLSHETYSDVWNVSFIWHDLFIHRSAITTREWSSDVIHIWWMTFIYDGWCCSYIMNDITRSCT